MGCVSAAPPLPQDTTGTHLLSPADFTSADLALSCADIATERTALEDGSGDEISDLHLWRVGPDHWAAIFSVVSHHPQVPEHYKTRLAHIRELSHVTVEVHPCAAA